MQKTCYACDRPATTREHIPPKCLFPKVSESTGLGFPGRDFRVNLFVVPSCEDHNLGKSKDDEYLWYALGFCNAINRLGAKLFLSRGMRAHLRSPKLFRRMMTTANMTTAIDAEGEYRVPKFYFEEERFVLLMEKIGKALYFKHFGDKYNGAVQTHVEYAGLEVRYAGLGGREIADMVVRKLIEGRSKIKNEFSGEAEYGDNKEIFFYSEKTINEFRMLRLTFYEGARILLIFGGDRSSMIR